MTATFTLTVRESTPAGIGRTTRIDRAAGVVYGVKLLGRRSLNGRRYTDAAIGEAFAAVEKTPSYVDHPPGESNARSIRERFGRFVGPYCDGDGTLCAREFRYSPKHDFADGFGWLLEHAPADIGFSINAKAVGRTDPDGTPVIDSFPVIYSFDLVDRPATTGGVFASVRESVQSRMASTLGRFDPRVEARKLFGPPPPAFDVGEATRRIFGQER